MVKVAVIGGSGQVGRTIVKALRNDPGHSVIVLGRKASANPDPEAPVVVADFTDVESLKILLEQHLVEAVISCLGIHDETIAQIEKNMTVAADKSTTVKRFIHSNWAVPNTPGSETSAPWAVPNTPGSETSAPWAPFQLASQAHLRDTSLEATEIANGYFLDYWGMPHIHTHLTPMMPALDIAAKTAALPGDGDVPVSFTYSIDVARVVARMLEQPLGTWEETTYALGDKLIWNEFLALAEEARGAKFEASYDTVEALSRFQLTELPNHRAVYPYFPKESLQWLYVTLELMMVRGEFDLPSEKAVNRNFPDIKMMTAEEILEKAWKGK